MVNPIYPAGAYSISGVTPYNKKNDTAYSKVSEQRYDQVHFSSHLDEMEKQLKDTVGHISQEIRIRPTHQEIDALRHQIAAGTYEVNAREIAARMLLRKDG